MSDTLRLAAIGDLHVNEQDGKSYRDLFREISDNADVLALCGDLTNFGKTGEAERLASDLSACSIPVVGVLGNHDYECGQPEEVAHILRQGGMTLLDEQAVGGRFRRRKRLRRRLRSRRTGRVRRGGDQDLRR